MTMISFPFLYGNGMKIYVSPTLVQSGRYYTRLETRYSTLRKHENDLGKKHNLTLDKSNSNTIG